MFRFTISLVFLLQLVSNGNAAPCPGMNIVTDAECVTACTAQDATLTSNFQPSFVEEDGIWYKDFSCRCGSTSICSGKSEFFKLDDKGYCPDSDLLACAGDEDSKCQQLCTGLALPASDFVGTTRCLVEGNEISCECDACVNDKFGEFGCVTGQIPACKKGFVTSKATFDDTCGDAFVLEDGELNATYCEINMCEGSYFVKSKGSVLFSGADIFSVDACTCSDGSGCQVAKATVDAADLSSCKKVGVKSCQDTSCADYCTATFGSPENKEPVGTGCVLTNGNIACSCENPNDGDDMVLVCDDISGAFSMSLGLFGLFITALLM